MPNLPNNPGPALIAVARAGIAHALTMAAPKPPAAQWLEQPGASFVTLTLAGQLRGCIGTLEAHRALGQDVHQNALAAAFHDPRFAPLSSSEYGQVKIEVSVPQTPEPMAFSSQQDALDQLRPGLDGVILQAGGRRATFLPQVWAQLPKPEDFLAHLKLKAGLPASYWSGVKLWRYGVQAFEEA